MHFTKQTLTLTDPYPLVNMPPIAFDLLKVALANENMREKITKGWKPLSSRQYVSKPRDQSLNVPFFVGWSDYRKWFIFIPQCEKY